MPPDCAETGGTGVQATTRRRKSIRQDLIGVPKALGVV
jgi:hypothetical protein